MTNARTPRAVERRVLIVLLGISVLEAIPLVEALAGVRIVGFWPLGEVLAKPATIAGWALALATAAAYCWVSLRRNEGVARRLREFGVLKLAALLLAAASGLTEELFFRGALMDILDGAGAPLIVQVVVSAVAFGAAHIVWIGLTGPRAIRGVIGATTVLGAALAVVYLVAGRSILPCVLTHFAVNAVLEPGLALTGAERRWGRLSAPDTHA